MHRSLLSTKWFMRICSSWIYAKAMVAMGRISSKLWPASIERPAQISVSTTHFTMRWICTKRTCGDVTVYASTANHSTAGSSERATVRRGQMTPGGPDITNRAVAYFKKCRNRSQSTKRKNRKYPPEWHRQCHQFQVGHNRKPKRALDLVVQNWAAVTAAKLLSSKHRQKRRKFKQSMTLHQRLLQATSLRRRLEAISAMSWVSKISTVRRQVSSIKSFSSACPSLILHFDYRSADIELPDWEWQTIECHCNRLACHR